MIKQLFLKLTVLLIAACTFQGCASYNLGSPSEQAYSTVFVRPVINDTTFPLLESSLTSSTRKAINETGILRSDDKQKADTSLKVEILNLNRDIAAIQASDLGRGKKFELEMMVSMSLYEGTSDQSPIFENRTFQISQDIFADSDIETDALINQVDAENQATPELSRKIAQRIAEALTESW